MNYFDDYYSEPQQEPEQPNSYIPPEQPKAPKVRKERKGLRRVISAVLVLALVVGSCGITAAVMNRHWRNEMDAMLRRMDDKIAAVQKEAQSVPSENSGTSTGRPLATTGMTPGQVYAENVDAVVAITVEVSGYDNYGRPAAGYSSGTGFLITADGYVVTNYHVIEDGTAVTVTMHNDEEYDAQIVGYEENNDLALLKIEGEDFPHVTMGSSSDLLVGDQVVAIGNVLSTFASSLTVGYVSGVDRVVDTDGVAMNMIQTDVAINSGNSGGPLFNMKGEVVGITTAKFSGNSSSGVSIEGIGFAIPMDDVVGMIQDLQTYGYVTGAYLGVMVLDVESAAQYYGLPAGAYVESATEGGAADKGGIVAGDIITEVGGFAVTSVSDLTRVLRKFAAGETVSVEVYRTGSYKTLSVTLEEKPREEVPTETQVETQVETQTVPQQWHTVPESGNFEDWYDFFREFEDYFG